MKFRTILIDPPWQQTMIGKFHRENRAKTLTYPTMTIDQIAAMPIPDLADTNAHLWLWTTNQFLPDGFQLLKAWGFKYMIPVHWIKPSGLGAWWVHRTQTLLFAYRGKLDMKNKLKPNILHANSVRHSHSTKPECSYQLIETISHEARVELFARKERPGWTALGNAIDGKDIGESIKDQTK